MAKLIDFYGGLAAWYWTRRGPEQKARKWNDGITIVKRMYVIEAGITCQDGTKFAKRKVVGLFEGAFYDTDHVI